MRRHMYAVGEQRHGAEEEPRCNLDDHECGREKHRGAGAALGMLVAVAQEMVIVGPEAVIVGVVLRHAPNINARRACSNRA